MTAAGSVRGVAPDADPVTRRDARKGAAALAALGATAGLAVPGPARTASRDRVAIIAAGAGAITAAYLLGGACDVDVFEARDRIGCSRADAERASTTGSDIRETVVWSATQVATTIAPASPALRAYQARVQANGLADVSYDLWNRPSRRAGSAGAAGASRSGRAAPPWAAR